MIFLLLPNASEMRCFIFDADGTSEGAYRDRDGWGRVEGLLFNGDVFKNHPMELVDESTSR